MFTIDAICKKVMELANLANCKSTDLALMTESALVSFKILNAANELEMMVSEEVFDTLSHLEGWVETKEDFGKYIARILTKAPYRLFCIQGGYLPELTLLDETLSVVSLLENTALMGLLGRRVDVENLKTIFMLFGRGSKPMSAQYFIYHALIRLEELRGGVSASLCEPEVFNSELKGLDPYSSKLTTDQKAAMLEECKINPNYFLYCAKANRERTNSELTMKKEFSPSFDFYEQHAKNYFKRRQANKK